MTPGRFIVLEGIDGAGTTTQARLLTRWLTRAGRRVLQTNQPSGGPVGTFIRHALRGRIVAGDGQRLDPRAIAGLFVADRADHRPVRRHRRPAHLDGRTELPALHARHGCAQPRRGRDDGSDIDQHGPAVQLRGQRVARSVVR